MGGSMGPPSSGGVGGVSPQILQQLGIEGPISSTVFVANLDYKVTGWKLRDVFKLAGNVLNAEIKEDKERKSRGMGVVTFEHPMEAVQAVSMFHNQVLFDRKMLVRVDKYAEPEKPKLPSGLKSIGMGLGTGGAPMTNFNQLGSNLGLSGGAGLLGMGNLGGSSGLGLLGSGGDMGLGSLGGGMNFSGLGSSGGMGGGSGLGMGGSMSDLGLGNLGNLGNLGSLGGSKMGGMSDNFSNSYSGMGGSSLNGNNGIPGLGSLGPSLNSLSSGIGGMGSNDRMSMGGLERLGLDDGLGRDRMGLDRMGLDRINSMTQRMMGMDRLPGNEKMRDNYGNGRDMRDSRDDGSRRMTRPDNCTVICKNLPYNTTWQELKEHFRDAGDVRFAEIVMDKGKSAGFGYVRFSNENDCQRAIALKHRSRVDRRNIDVALHRN